MVDTAQDPVILKREGDVAVLIFNRPEAMNALDVPTAKAFASLCATLEADKGVRAVVIRGNGPTFGVGGDLKALKDDPGAASEIIEQMNSAVLILTALDAPVLACLHGAVAGGSLSLSMACDLAIAAEGTRFNLAYANVAASIDVAGSWYLPRLVGLRSAMALALLCETIDASEALRLGLINRIVPADAFDGEIAALAKRLAAGPTLAYGRMKRLLRRSSTTTLGEQLRDERDSFIEGTRTEDFKRALIAFSAKERPAFNGI